VYLITVILSMFVLPIASILIEFLVFRSSAGLTFLIGKWFVFWAVGFRLVLAGLRQAITPQFTTKKILGISAKEPLIVVQELGFANLSLGLLGIGSILKPAWVIPVAIAGCLFLGLAGIRHFATKHRNILENIALSSNLFVAIVLLAYLICTIAKP